MHAPHAHDAGGRRLLYALVTITAIMVAEIVGGLLSGSLALLADAGHMAVDAVALLLGYVAIRIGQRPPDERRTYGYRRAEILAALLNAVLLVVIVGFILVEAVQRLIRPHPVSAVALMIVVAGIGLVANGVAMMLLHGHRNATSNIRMAFIHVLGDTLSSCGVIFAGVVLMLTGWTFIDPLISIGISVVISWQVVKVLRESVDILMQGTPPHLSTTEIRRTLCGVEGVVAVQDLHVTTHATHQYVLTSRLIVADQTLEAAQRILQQARSVLAERHGICHATLELNTQTSSALPKDVCEFCS